MSVVVFADSKNGSIVKSSFEAISYGAKIGGGSCIAVTYGNVSEDALKNLGVYGASEVIIAKSVNSNDAGVLSLLVSNIVKEKSANVVVFSQDFTGKAVAPRTATKLGAGLVSGAIDYPKEAGDFIVRKTAFSGKAFAEVKINTPIRAISLLPNSIGITKTEGSATVTEYSGELGTAKITIKEVRATGDGSSIPLPEAELVVSAGRGLKGPENWGIVEDLANVMGATTACSRPVSDIGWRPHHEHVGQTGVAIRPNLYIAAGISGAIQHLAGVNGSKVIVVINTDSEAPFFKAADYGAVGDAFEVLPRLTESYKKFKEANN